MGFIGCNLNPDPGGGHFKHPPLTDEYWFPFYEKMVELDVPAMIHVSGSCNPAMHATGAYYIAADTIAFMQLLEGDLFGRFPRCASSSRMAAARCPITGAAIGGWPTC
jgi:4-oxalmesaconate hydratase